GLVVSHPDAVVDHQRRQTAAVDQNNVFRDLVAELSRLAREARTGDKNSLSRTPPRQCTEERLNLGTSDGTLPTLRLNVHALESQLVEGDNSIDPAVASFADTLQVFLTRAVSEREQEIEDQ